MRQRKNNLVMWLLIASAIIAGIWYNKEITSYLFSNHETTTLEASTKEKQTILRTYTISAEDYQTTTCTPPTEPGGGGGGRADDICACMCREKGYNLYALKDINCLCANLKTPPNPLKTNSNPPKSPKQNQTNTKPTIKTKTNNLLYRRKG